MHPKLLVSFIPGAAAYAVVIGFLVAWQNSFAAASALLGAVIGCGLTTAIVVFVARSYWQGVLHRAADDDRPEPRSAAAGRGR